MRRQKKQSGASLDSLLDTMTNVVGILVILLTVTQLGVQDAVKRISTAVTVDPEELRRAEQQHNELLKLEALLKQQLASLDDKGQDAEKSRKELGRALYLLQSAKHNINVLKEVQEDKRREIEAAIQKLLDEARQALEAQQKKEKELAAKVTTADAEVARLRAQLADTPETKPLAAKVVNLPNPRAAPENSQPVTYICREGRIMWVDAEGLQDRAQKRTQFIVARRRLDRDPSKGVDGKLLAEEFNRDPIRDRYFELQMTISGRYPRLVLKRLKNAGEDAELLVHPSSRYQQRVRRTDPRRFYLKYLVWPDSFEAYLEARKVASKRGLLAGWTTETTTAEYSIPLGGKLRVGPPPPPPKPKPKPKPGEKPPPPPKPKPPLPVDTID